MLRKITVVILALALAGCASTGNLWQNAKTEWSVVVQHVRADGPKLVADLKALKDDLYAHCDMWPEVYGAWLVFERFTGASATVQADSAIVDLAVRTACSTGNPKDIGTATAAVTNIYSAVRAIVAPQASAP